MNRMLAAAIVLASVLPTAQAQEVRAHGGDIVFSDPLPPIEPPSRNRPPAAITDLSDAGASETSISFTWHAPVDPDDLMAAAAGYDVRFSTVDPATFASDVEWYGSATPAGDEPLPAEPGKDQSMTLAGLAPGTNYFVAITTTDGSAWSGVSNVLATATLTSPPTPDPSEQPQSTSTSGPATGSGCGQSAADGAMLLALAAILAAGGRR